MKRTKETFFRNFPSEAQNSEISGCREFEGEDLSKSGDTQSTRRGESSLRISRGSGSISRWRRRGRERNRRSWRSRCMPLRPWSWTGWEECSRTTFKRPNPISWPRLQRPTCNLASSGNWENKLSGGRNCSTKDNRWNIYNKEGSSKTSTWTSNDSYPLSGPHLEPCFFVQSSTQSPARLKPKALIIWNGCLSFPLMAASALLVQWGRLV